MTEYERGFIDKCAELGVDPVKLAAFGSVLRGARKLYGVVNPPQQPTIVGPMTGVRGGLALGRHGIAPHKAPATTPAPATAPAPAPATTPAPAAQRAPAAVLNPYGMPLRWAGRLGHFLGGAR